MCYGPGEPLPGPDADPNAPDADPNAPDADPALPDAGPGDPDAAVPASPCNQVTLVADGFATATRGPLWGSSYVNNGATTSQVSSRLRVTLAANQSAAAYAAYATDRLYDLTASRVVVNLPQMVNTASHAQAYFKVGKADGGTNLAWFEQENGTLYLRTRTAGVTSAPTTLSYSATQHRYWQFREAAGRLLFETSADGVTFTVRRDVAAPFDLTLVQVELGAGTYQAEASPGFAEFDDVNGGTASGSYCKAGSITDDFNDGVRDRRWSRSFTAPACVLAENAGTFVGTPPNPATAEAYCGYQSAAAFDLTGSQVEVEVTQMLNVASPALAFVKVADAQNQRGVELAVENGVLECHFWLNGSRATNGQTPWNAVTHRFWRLAESGGQLLWQTSPDGATWNTLCMRGTIGIDVDDVEIAFGVGVPGAAPGAPAPGSFRLENLNLVP